MSKQSTPIAIIGMGCRFPGANNPQEFWQLLYNGVDAITDLSSIRDKQASILNEEREELKNIRNLRTRLNFDSFQFDHIGTQFGGFIEKIDQFDNDFFDISPHEAKSIDPQQRLLLEVGWETLEHAGLDPAQLAGIRGGIFVGISTGDYAYLKENSLAVDAYFNVGSAFSIAANRLSYFLDWHGPSWAVDTACSSSLVAVHQACQSLRLGECNLAMAAGVNLVLRLKPTLAFAQAQMLASDGRCKAFDASADGYVRGEGIGAVLLKPLPDAVADRDSIYAVIRGSAVNQDGLSNGLMAPNLAAQVAVVQAAYEQAQVDPAQVQYVEAHGTGTKLGDSIEIHALSRVLSKNRAVDNVCMVGSVKTNIGHLEAASGIAGLIKVILSMQHQQLPASLHFQTPNPFVQFDAIPLRVQQTLTPWPQGEHDTVLAGVHSFGFGGTNVHVVLDGTVPVTTVKESLERPLHVLTLSGKTKQALRDLVALYRTYLDTDLDTALTDMCYTANTGRTHFNYRLSIIAANSQEFQAALSCPTLELAVDRCFWGDLLEDFQEPNIAFLFSGVEKLVLGMGHQLYETQPTFKRALDECADCWKGDGVRSLLEVLGLGGNLEVQEYRGIEVQKYRDAKIDLTLEPLALFALEYALYQLWQSWGIRPKSLIGHDIGEAAAACVAGVFSLEDGLKLVALWSKIRHCSSPMDSMLEEIQHVVQQVKYSRPKIQLVSLVTGQVILDEVSTSDYWYQKLCSSRDDFSVDVMAGVTGLYQQKIDIVLECGPQSSLCELYRRGFDDEETICLSSLCSGLEHGQNDWQQILSSLSMLYVRGVNVDWNGFDQDYPQRRKVSLPTYPFQRKRYWINSSAEQGLTIQNRDMGDVSVEEALCHHFPRQLSLVQSSLLQQLYAAPSAERSTVLMQNLQHELQELLRLPQIPESDVNFSDLGMDSLTTITFRNRLQQQLGKTYTVSYSLLLDYPNSYQLAEYLNKQLDYSQPEAQTHSNVENIAPEASPAASPQDSLRLHTTPHIKVYRSPQIIHTSQLFFWLKLVSMNIGVRFGIKDGISTDCLIQACSIVSDRYDTLTSIIDTQYPTTTGQYYSQPLRIPIIQHSPSFTIQQEKEQFWAFYRCPFNAQHGPPIRFEIHKGWASGRELWIALDHISFDGHSVSILFEDLNTLLRGESLPAPQSYYDLPSPEVCSQDVAFWHQYLNAPPLLTIPKALLRNSPGESCRFVSRKLIDQLQEQYRTVEEFEQLIIAATVGAIARITQQSAFTVCMVNKDSQRTPETHRVFGPLVQTNLLVFRHIPSQFSPLLSLVVQETERIRPHRNTPDVIKYWQFQQRVFGRSINLLVSIISFFLKSQKKFSVLNNSFLREASVQLWVGKRLRTFLKTLPNQMNSQSPQKTLVSINMFSTFIAYIPPSQDQALNPLPRYDHPKEFTYVSCRFEGEGNGHDSPVILVKGAGLEGQVCNDIASHIATILEKLRE